MTCIVYFRKFENWRRSRATSFHHQEKISGTGPLISLVWTHFNVAHLYWIESKVTGQRLPGLCGQTSPKISGKTTATNTRHGMNFRCILKPLWSLRFPDFVRQINKIFSILHGKKTASFRPGNPVTGIAHPSLEHSVEHSVEQLGLVGSEKKKKIYHLKYQLKCSVPDFYQNCMS